MGEPSTAPLAPRHLPVVGHLPAFRRDPLGLLVEAMLTRGDVARLDLPGHAAHLFFHPDHVRALLVDDAKCFSKNTPAMGALRLLMGNGLVTSEGSFWLRQRRIAQPAFHRNNIHALCGQMVALTARTAGEWSEAARDGRDVDVGAAMTRLTLRIVGAAMLGCDVEGEAADVARAIDHLQGDLNARILAPWSPPVTWPTARSRAFHEARDVVWRVVERAIARRRADPDAPGGAFLRMLMDARDAETGEAMDDRQLRDEVVTVAIAGYETTANVLAWAWVWLARFPAARRRLAAELDAVLGDRDPTGEDHARLPYARAVVAETLRLAPSVWIVARRVERETVVGGQRLRAGELAFVSPYATHRHPTYWPDPEGFDPERFLDGAKDDRPTLAYFPFGAGPRKCIGETFALVEATMLLATLARRFELALRPGAEPAHEPAVTLRLKRPVLMRVRPRG
ncbi:MAG: cytochrome P450 [Polyangiales bacterium]